MLNFLFSFMSISLVANLIIDNNNKRCEHGDKEMEEKNMASVEKS